MKFPNDIRCVAFIKSFVQWLFLNLLLAATRILESLTDQLLGGNQWPSDSIHWEGAYLAKNMNTLFPRDSFIFSVSGVKAKFRNSMFIILAAIQTEIPGRNPHTEQQRAHRAVSLVLLCLWSWEGASFLRKTPHLGIWMDQKSVPFVQHGYGKCTKSFHLLYSLLYSFRMFSFS